MDNQTTQNVVWYIADTWDIWHLQIKFLTDDKIKIIKENEVYKYITVIDLE